MTSCHTLLSNMHRVGLALLQARTTVVIQLQSLLQLTDLADYQDIIRIMVIIAKQMLPAPPPPPLPPPLRQPRVSRFSCDVMSAPPDGYVLPSSSDTSEYEEEEEEEEMSSDHSVQNMRTINTLHILPHSAGPPPLKWISSMFPADSHTLQEDPLKRPHP
jgi:hypothetical protein